MYYLIHYPTKKNKKNRLKFGFLKKKFVSLLCKKTMVNSKVRVPICYVKISAQWFSLITLHIGSRVSKALIRVA